MSLVYILSCSVAAHRVIFLHRMRRRQQLCHQEMLEEGHCHDAADDLAHEGEVGQLGGHFYSTSSDILFLCTDQDLAGHEREEKSRFRISCCQL